MPSANRLFISSLQSTLLFVMVELSAKPTTKHKQAPKEFFPHKWNKEVANKH